MAEKDYISQLSPYLFWDTNRDTYDVEKYSAALIQRVLERGQMKDWRLTRNYFGIDRIAAECKKLRTLDPKALSYICLISHTQKEDYRCYQFAQSFQTLWNS